MMQVDLTALEDLLDRTLACILAGDIGALAATAAATEAALTGLNAMPDSGTAQRIRRKAEHNAVCLAATARGLRAAQRRVAEIRALRDGTAQLSTYDLRGQRAEAIVLPRGLTRRL